MRAPRLKYVDPTRSRGRLSHAYAAFFATRLGRFLSAKMAWKVDPYLLRATRGRVGLGLPSALLETRGAKTGATICSPTPMSFSAASPCGGRGARRTTPRSTSLAKGPRGEDLARGSGRSTRMPTRAVLRRAAGVNVTRSGCGASSGYRVHGCGHRRRGDADEPR